MFFLKMIGVVVALTLTGGLLGVLFANQISFFLLKDELCYTLYSGNQLKLLDPARQRLLLEAASKAPDLDRTTLAYIVNAKTECRP